MANYKRWTDAEREYIRSNHKTLCDEELAKVLSQMTGEVITTSMVRRQRRHYPHPHGGIRIPQWNHTSRRD